MRRTLPLFIAKEDREFLWQWAKELQERYRAPDDPHIAPHHFIAALVEQMRDIKGQGRLFDNELSELEAAALRAAREQQAEVDNAIRDRREQVDSHNRMVDEINAAAMEQYQKYLHSPKSAMKWEMVKKVEQLEQELREKEAGVKDGSHAHT